MALGYHNTRLAEAAERLRKGGTYRDLSTVIVTPTRGGLCLAPRVVQSWAGLMTPMNQRVYNRIWVEGDEVGVAYSRAVAEILANPGFKGWRYMLTIEDDVMPPPDGLLKLYEAIEGGVDGQKYDAVGGLYWTKGPGGQPMIYGDPNAMPLNFVPRGDMVGAETVVPAAGLGMGFNLFRLSMFKDKELPQPLFQTKQQYTPGVGAMAYTQDLWFYQKAGALGYRFACDTRVKCGHYDWQTGEVW